MVHMLSTHALVGIHFTIYKVLEGLLIRKCLNGDIIFLIVGKSGAGKNSICDRVENRLGAKQLESYTTRRPRFTHEKGHRFVWRYELWKAEHPDEQIVAETHFAGSDYWATATQIDEANTYIVDMAGVRRLRATYRGKKEIRVIYIKVSALERYVRMRRRGDSRRDAVKRLLHDHKAFRGVLKCSDVVICNKDFEECCEDVEGYMLEEDRICAS